VTPRASSGRAARQGAVLGLGSQMARQLLSVLATVVLARLLTPTDFGIVAAANTLLGLVAIGTTLGFAPAVIRRASVDDTFLSSMFWTSLAVAVVGAGGVMALSPLLASMFGRPDAALYLVVLAPALVCDVCASIPLALLQRRLQFHSLYGCQTGSMVVYVAVQVVLAFAGAGAWAVILGQLAMSTTNLAAAVVLARWYPRFRFRADLVRDEVGFASGVMTGQVLAYGLKSLDYWAVGRSLGGSALGVYYIAFQLPSILRLRMSSVSRQVLFPVFVHERESNERTAAIYLSTMRLQIGLGLPAMVGVAAVSAPLILVFFGDQWAASIEPMRWLALAAVFEIIISPAGSIAIAHGRLRPYLASLVVRLVVMVAALVAAGALGTGLTAFAVAMLLQSVLGAVVTQVMVARPLGLPTAAVVRPLLLSAGPAALMYVAVRALLAEVATLPAPVELALGVLVGAAVHVAALRVLSRSELAFLSRQAAAMLRSVTRRRPRSDAPATAPQPVEG
jgi:lipopolysaccharide exporter